MQEHVGEFMLEDLGVLIGLEVAMLLARLDVGQHDAVDELLQAPLTLLGSERTAEVLRGDDRGGVHTPKIREFHTTLFENNVAILPVRLHHIAPLPIHRVVWVHPFGGVQTLDPEPWLLERVVHEGCRCAGRDGHDGAFLTWWLADAGSLLGGTDIGFFTERLALCAEQGDLGFEIFKGVEGAVDRCETQVRDFVEFAQRAEDRQSDLHGRDLRRAGGAQRVFNPLGEQGEIVVADRSTLACLANARDDLVASERLLCSGSLRDKEHGGFGRGEPTTAGRAFPAAADRAGILDGTGVDHARVISLTERASHRWTLLSLLVTSITFVPTDLPRQRRWMGNSCGRTVDVEPQPVEESHRCDYNI